MHGFRTGKLKFVQEYLPVTFWVISSLKRKQGVADQKAEIERALSQPIGTQRLSEIAKAGNKVAIVVDDATRATPSHMMIIPLLDELNKAGVKDEDVTVIFGCGSHRPVTEQEKEKLIGKEALERVKAINHDLHGRRSGFSRRNIPWNQSQRKQSLRRSRRKSFSWRHKPALLRGLRRRKKRSASRSFKRRNNSTKSCIACAS